MKDLAPLSMKFTIVTPNYNYGRFLQKTLKSVLAQADAPGAPTLEHIVIDGGSTDDSVAILSEWEAFATAQSPAKNGRYSFAYVSEPDRGQTDAINKGLRRATGDIVAWLNADEWYLPGRLAHVAATFARHPTTDFVYGEPLYTDGDGKTIRIKRDHAFSKFVLLHYGCFIASCCSFWRRRIQTEGKIFLDPSYKVTMDYEFYCRICRAGYRFLFIPSTVAAFTWHGGNVSSEFDDRRREEVRTVRTQGGRVSPAVDALLHWLAHRWRQCLVVFRLIFFSQRF